jgi:hypothetical protein
VAVSEGRLAEKVSAATLFGVVSMCSTFLNRSNGHSTGRCMASFFTLT